MADIFRETQRSFLGIDLLADRAFTDNSTSASLKKTALTDTINRLKKEDAEANAAQIQDLQTKLTVLEGYIKNKEFDKAFFDYNLDGEIGTDADQNAQTNDLEITAKSLEKQRFFNDYDRGTNIRMDHGQRIFILNSQISREKNPEEKAILELQRDILQDYIDTRDTDLYLDYNLDGVVDEKDDLDKQQDVEMETHRDTKQRFYQGHDMGADKTMTLGTEMKRSLETRIKEATNFEQRQELEAQLAILNDYIAVRSGDMFLDYNLDGTIDEADAALRAEDQKLEAKVQRHFLGHKFSKDTFLDNDARLDALEELKDDEVGKSGKDAVQAQIDQLNAYIEAGDQESIELDYNLDGEINRRDELERENDILRDEGEDTLDIEEVLEEEEREANLANQEERIDNTINQGNQTIQDTTDVFNDILNGGSTDESNATQEASNSVNNTSRSNSINDLMKDRFMDLLNQLLLLEEDDPARRGIISQLTAIQSLYDVQGVTIPGVDLDALLSTSSSGSSSSPTGQTSPSTGSGFSSPGTETAQDTVNDIINNRFLRNSLRTGFSSSTNNDSSTGSETTEATETNNEPETPQFERKFNFSRGLLR